MTKTKKTLFLSDLDGTLLRSDAVLSPYARRMWQQWRDRGVLLSFATARALYSARQVLGNMEITLPFVSYNGALVRDARRVYRAACFTPAQCREIIGIFMRVQLLPRVYSMTNGQERASYLRRWDTPAARRFLQLKKDDPRLFPVDSEARLPTDDVFYFSCVEEAIPYEIYELFRSLPYAKTFWLDDSYPPYDRYLEIVPAGADKGASALWLKKFLNAERLVVFGDGVNDLELFDAADEKYAVSNAEQALKARADEVIAGNDEDGVVRKIAELLARGY